MIGICTSKRAEKTGRKGLVCKLNLDRLDQSPEVLLTCVWTLNLWDNVNDAAFIQVAIKAMPWPKANTEATLSLLLVMMPQQQHLA
jgi:hypothetical protein